MQLAIESRFDVQGIDLFADRDSQTCSNVHKVGGFEDVPALTKTIDYDHCILTGGIENHSAVIRQLADTRIRGCGVECLATLADSYGIIRHWESHEIAVPETRFELNSDQAGTSGWLVKRRWSCGGNSIVALPAQAVGDTGNQEDHFIQKFVPGGCYSAIVFYEESRFEVLGVSRQLTGQLELTHNRFAYCGSLGPLPLSPEIELQLATIAQSLVSVQPRGFVGIDFVLDNGTVWPLEVNPRITASMPMHLKGSGVDLIESQIAGRLIRDRECDIAVPVCYGKAILFNLDEAELKITGEFSDWAMGESEWLGDIPFAGTSILPQSPILTTFNRGHSLPAVEAQLFAQVKRVREQVQRTTIRV